MKFLVVLLFCFSTVLNASPYIIKNIENASNQESKPSDMNNRNEVVGKLKIDKESFDFIWSEAAGLRVLPIKQASINASPMINNQGDVAGVYWHVTDYWFSDNTGTKQIYLVRADGTVKEIPPPKDWKSQVLEASRIKFSFWDDRELDVAGINDLGQILIIHRDSNKKLDAMAIWENDSYQFIDVADLSNTYGFNNQGIVLGVKYAKEKAGCKSGTLCTYDPKTKTTKKIAEDVKIFIAGFNDKGQVYYSETAAAASCCCSKDFFPTKSWLRENDQSVDLNDFIAVSINNCNQAVGLKLSDIRNNTPVIFLRDKDELVPVFEQDLGKNTAKGKVNGILQINDNGAMMGTIKSDGTNHAIFISK